MKTSSISSIAAKYFVVEKKSPSFITNFNRIFNKASEVSEYTPKINFELSQLTKSNRISKHSLQSLFKNKSHLEVWRYYKHGKNCSTGIENDLALAAREELLKVRYKDMLNKVAWKAYQYYKKSKKFNGTEEVQDFFAHSVIGACLAFNGFDETRSPPTTLTTYVYTTMQKHMLQEMDATLSVHCPTQKRGMRTYLSGGYDADPDKKREFEIKNKLFSEESISVAREKYKLLIETPLNFDECIIETEEEDFNGVDIIVDTNQPTADQISTRLDRDRILGELTIKQQEIYILYFVNDINIREIAKEANLTSAQVNIEIGKITGKLKSTIYSV